MKKIEIRKTKRWDFQGKGEARMLFKGKKAGAVPQKKASSGI